MKKNKNKILKIFCQNISTMIIETLVLLAPMIWLVINIYNKKKDTILLNGIVAFISLVLLILMWIYYFKYLKNDKDLLKKNNKNNILIIPLLLLTIVVVLLSFILMNVIIENFMISSDYIFYEIPLLLAKITMFLIMILFITLFAFILKKLNINKTESLEVYLDIWKKFKYYIIIGFVLVMYSFFTSVTYVTENTIVYKEPLHPKGITYNYKDVSKIETGFGTKSFSFVDYERRGQFYYRIFFGKKSVTFSVPSVNDKIKKYMSDTYLELEEFDKALTKLNIKKESNNKYAKDCNLDKEYCDRFVRIINNKISTEK